MTSNFEIAAVQQIVDHEQCTEKITIYVVTANELRKTSVCSDTRLIIDNGATAQKCLAAGLDLESGQPWPSVFFCFEPTDNAIAASRQFLNRKSVDEKTDVMTGLYHTWCGVPEHFKFGGIRLTGGLVTGASVTGGSVTGGSVSGWSVTGGSVTGGSVPGSSVGAFAQYHWSKSSSSPKSKAVEPFLQWH